MLGDIAIGETLGQKKLGKQVYAVRTNAMIVCPPVSNGLFLQHGPSRRGGVCRTPDSLEAMMYRDERGHDHISAGGWHFVSANATFVSGADRQQAEPPL